MKLKNNKTNPFSPLVALAETGRPAGNMLSFAINTAQKNHKITGEMTKLGPLKLSKQSQLSVMCHQVSFFKLAQFPRASKAISINSFRRGERQLARMITVPNPPLASHLSDQYAHGLIRCHGYPST